MKVRTIGYKVYDGEPLEIGKTSIYNKKVASGIEFLFNNGLLLGKILDYGAGRYGRNAEYLRGKGLTVYAYDPYNGTDCNGYEKDCVSNKLPEDHFDIGFTSYVLNVVPEYVKEDIINNVKSFCNKSYHIARNMDVFDSAKNSLKKKNKLLLNFIKNVYNQEVTTDDDIMNLCIFGYQTKNGFQRITKTEGFGFKIIKNTNGYKIYEEERKRVYIFS